MEPFCSRCAFLVFLMTVWVAGIRDLLRLVGGGTLVSRDMKAQDQPVAGVRIMAAMKALSALKQVWEAQGSSAAAGAELMREAQKHTAVRVIDHEGDCKGWGTSDLFQMLRTTGFMNVGMSDNPCSLDYPEHPATGTRYNPMPELTHLLARAFRDQANRDATGTAIIVSHYRALSEAAHSINQQGLIVVFERDFQPGINCFYQLQFVFREFFKLPKEERPHYFSLCSSVDRLDHTGPIVKLALDSPARVRGRGWYWLPHPWQDKPGGHVALQHLGQGARAYAVEALFVRWLLENQQVWCWWDVYLSGEACNYAMRRRNGNRNTTILVFPTLGSHPVVLSDATRGSDRLRSMLPNAAAKLAPFITLELKAGCGFSNRLNTMAITRRHATMQGSGCISCGRNPTHVLLYWRQWCRQLIRTRRLCRACRSCRCTPSVPRTSEQLNPLACKATSAISRSRAHRLCSGRHF